MMYKYYLLPDAKKELDRASEKEKINAFDTIEKLINGLWGGGTRVKKLHGVSKTKCIYEAREDSGRRLLFSIGKKEGNFDTPIYIHNVCIEHDKVIRMAQRIIGCDFTSEIYNKTIEKRNVTASELIEEEKKFSEQNYIFSVIEDTGCYEINDTDVYRYLEQKEVTKDESIAFRLKLSKEQKEILNEPLPKFIAGTAGSGKTTVLLYNLMTNPESKKLYITSNKELCNESKALFHKLIKNSDYESEYKNNTYFHTFEEILYDTLNISINKMVTKEKFIYEYIKYSRGIRNSKEFEPLKIWEEIRSVWKSDIKSITKEKYLSLKNHEAPNFYNKREEAYKILTWYDKFLEDNLYYDEIDLLREYFNKKIKNNNTYECIVCDEVQDLTMTHIEFIVSLSNNKPQNIIIAGDDHQIINHSGFSWEKLKRYYYEKFKIKTELYALEKNFRCIGNIANLANEVNRLQEEFTDKKYKVKLLDSLPYGNKPELINCLNEDTVIDELKNLGPLKAILVNEKKDKQELKEKFMKKFNYSPLIFSIEESKGLEFDSVILWRLISGDIDKLNKWKKVFRSKNINDNKQLSDFIKYNTSLIYVAITRAMRGCVIYEEKDNMVLWEYPNIKKNINIRTLLNEEITTEEYQNIDEEWLIQGKELLKKKFYNEARECFERIKKSDLKELSQKYIKESFAKELFDKGVYEEAAKIFLELNDEENMERCYDLVGDYDELYNYYVSKGRGANVEKIKEYGIKNFDKKNQWEKSAIYCWQKKLYNESIVRYEKVENYKRIAKIYLDDLNDPVQATKYYIKSGDIKSEKMFRILQYRLVIGSEHNKSKQQIQELQKARISELFIIGREFLKFESLANLDTNNILNPTVDKQGLEHLLISKKTLRGCNLQNINWHEKVTKDFKEILQKQLWILESGQLISLNYHYCCDKSISSDARKFLGFSKEQSFDIFNLNEAIISILKQIINGI